MGAAPLEASWKSIGNLTLRMITIFRGRRTFGVVGQIVAISKIPRVYGQEVK